MFGVSAWLRDVYNRKIAVLVLYNLELADMRVIHLTFELVPGHASAIGQDNILSGSAENLVD